jgi:hypothetical protein
LVQLKELSMTEDMQQRGDRVLKVILRGALNGVAIALAFLAVVGAALGGLYQVAPCHGGDAYRSGVELVVGGVIFGMLYCFLYYGLPAALLGALAGAGIAWLGRRFGLD